MGGMFGMELPHISLAAEKLFAIGPLVVTNSLVMMLIAMALVLGMFIWTARRAAVMPGGRVQGVGEVFVEALLGLVEGVAGRTLGRRIFPLIAALFLFILMANWSALLPGVGAIGFYEPPHAVEADASHATAPAGKEADHSADAKTATKATTKAAEPAKAAHPIFVPFFRAANADLNMTIAMALIAVIYVQVIGVSAHGVGGYLKELATPAWLAPVHVISELSRIISLSCRLFGNIFGGEVFVVVIFFLFPLVLPVLPLILEYFFGFIQAVLFSVLTLVYLSLAAAGHGGHGDEHAHGDAEHHSAVASAHAGD
ncbi:MAG: F0F1 ATP synthase subunit A [Chloroflexi bacterium]|nr:F0F1 ATP synthase subunit A [Chloroflexota bacterium]